MAADKVRHPCEIYFNKTVQKLPTMRKYCNSTDIHPRRQTDGWMEVWRLRNPPALLRSALRQTLLSMLFYSAGKARSFREANSNRNRCTDKINRFSHTYTIGMIKEKWDTLWMCDKELQFLFNMVVNTNARTDNL